MRELVTIESEVAKFTYCSVTGVLHGTRATDPSNEGRFLQNTHWLCKHNKSFSIEAASFFSPVHPVWPRFWSAGSAYT